MSPELLAWAGVAKENPLHVPGGVPEGGQFDQGGGDKGPKLGIKAALHALLSTGKPFTLDELKAATGAAHTTLLHSISELKNPKYCPAGKPALAIVNQGGKYYVKDPTGAKTDAPTPKPEAAAPKPEGTPKEIASKEYNAKIAAALANLQLAAKSGIAPNSAIVEFKQDRLIAQAQFHAAYYGTPYQEPTITGKVFESDKKLYAMLAAAPQSAAQHQAAYSAWKSDTAKEKQGAKVEAAPKPEPTPKAEAASKPEPTATPKEPAAIKPIGEIIRQGASVKENVHRLMSSGQKFTIDEMHAALGGSKATIQTQISSNKNSATAYKGEALSIVKEGNYYRASGVIAKPATDLTATLGGIHANDFKDGTGGFQAEASRLYEAMHKGEYSSQDTKTVIMQQIASRLAGDKEWEAAAKAYTDHIGMGGHSKDPGERLASKLVSEWAGSSGDHHDTSRAMQLAAREEFGLKSAMVSHMHMTSHADEEKVWKGAASQIMGGSSDKEVALFKAAAAAFTRAEYANTQDWFTKNGFKEIFVYRGVHGDSAKGGEPHVGVFNGQPLSSFSSKLSTAGFFGGKIYMAKFPVSAVVGMCRSGRGCLSESEVVVMGRPTASVIVGMKALNSSSPNKAGRKAFGVT